MSATFIIIISEIYCFSPKLSSFKVMKIIPTEITAYNYKYMSLRSHTRSLSQFSSLITKYFKVTNFTILYYDLFEPFSFLPEIMSPLLKRLLARCVIQPLCEGLTRAPLQSLWWWRLWRLLGRICQSPSQQTSSRTPPLPLHPSVLACWSCNEVLECWRSKHCSASAVRWSWRREGWG